MSSMLSRMPRASEGCSGAGWWRGTKVAGGSVVLVPVGLTVGGFKLRFLQTSNLSEPKPKSSPKGFRARLAGIVGLWYVVIFIYG